MGYVPEPILIYIRVGYLQSVSMLDLSRSLMNVKLTPLNRRVQGPTTRIGTSGPNKEIILYVDYFQPIFFYFSYYFFN